MKLKDITIKYLNHPADVIGEHKEFAVMVPLIVMDDDTYVLFEVRSDNVEQPGEVCLPGGPVEDGEKPVLAAIRETVEELGLKKEAAYDPTILKEFAAANVLYGPGFTLSSFLCELDQTAVENSTPDLEEVSYTFLVPVDRLMELEPVMYDEKLIPDVDKDFPYEKVGIPEDYPWRTTHHEIPVYEVDGHIIWGLTARVIKAFLDHLKGIDKWEK